MEERRKQRQRPARSQHTNVMLTGASALCKLIRANVVMVMSAKKTHPSPLCNGRMGYTGREQKQDNETFSLKTLAGILSRICTMGPPISREAPACHGEEAGMLVVESSGHSGARKPQTRPSSSRARQAPAWRMTRPSVVGRASSA